MILGPRIVARRRGLTDSLYRLVDQGEELNEKRSANFLEKVKAILPKDRIMDYKARR